MKLKIEFTIPLTKDLIVSEANRSNEHWTKKHKRHVTQKFLIRAYLSTKTKPNLPCKITMTRIAPRTLDADDNLPMAFKSWKDYIADFLIPGLQMGRADDSKDLIWVYKQKKGKVKEYSINVLLEHNESAD